MENRHPDVETPLKQILLDRIRSQTRIPFISFMAACLYEPGIGYYTSPGRKVGAEGDFYTSSNVHAVFGRLIGREICRMWEVMGSPTDFQIVEVGAGNGRLAADILDTIAAKNSALYQTVTYRLIETEPTLIETQSNTLANHLPRLAWSTPSDLANGKLQITGCFVSNELIDSFPVHLVEMTADGLREVYVTTRDNEFVEILAEPSTPELAAYLERLRIKLVEGQRSEINLAALSWLESVANSLERGFVLTIDYGYPAEEMYGPMRLNGTLLCYYRHTVEENPFLRPGLQDITSHVDFTSFISHGEKFALKPVWFGEQYRFLMGTGMLEEILELEAEAKTEEERIKNRLTLKKLLLPEGGMGDTFRVLIQQKGVERPSLLCMRDWGKSF